MMENYQTIHQQALIAAKRFHKSEAELLTILDKVEQYSVFRKLGFSSLFDYAIRALKLSEGQAYAFIRVARKSKEVPELKTAIDRGALNVSTAKRIVSVINTDNKDQWLEKATTLAQKELELEVVKENPKEKIYESIKPVAEDLSELRCPVSSRLKEKLERARDILSQKQGKAVSLEETLELMTDSFLERGDPIKRADRNVHRANNAKGQLSCRTVQKRFSRVIPAKVRHEVNGRDQGQCTYRDKENRRCPNRRWLEIHHVKPFSQGGLTDTCNLTTLCFHHHKRQHE